MRILEATASRRSIWYQKNHPFVTFMDIRSGSFDTKTKNMKFKSSRRFKINPDVVSGWKDAPFPDNYFDMIIFDPPHIIRKKDKKITSSLEVCYGYFYEDNYKIIIKEGVNKLFQILRPEGVFILKWCEVDKKVDEILKLFPYKPLVGTQTGQNNQTHWILFLKYRVEKNLKEW